MTDAGREERLERLSIEKLAENMAAFEATCERQHMTKVEEHAFECGWDWAFVEARKAVEQAVPEGEPRKRKWKFVEARDVDEFTLGTKLGGALYDETGAKLSVIGTVDAERIANLLNGTSDLADARVATLCEALEGLGVKPDGYCFCLDQAQINDGHTGECLQARAALAAVEQATKVECPGCATQTLTKGRLPHTCEQATPKKRPMGLSENPMVTSEQAGRAAGERRRDDRPRLRGALAGSAVAPGMERRRNRVSIL